MISEGEFYDALKDEKFLCHCSHAVSTPNSNRPLLLNGDDIDDKLTVVVKNTRRVLTIEGKCPYMVNIIHR